MQNPPLVSILMNCYNAEEFINNAIQSVLNQKYKNWELVVWDDASSDNTVYKIKKFNDKRIKLFTNQIHLGLGKSRVDATKELNGSLVSILDSDDYYHPDKLIKQVKIFERFPNVSICATWVKVFNENHELVYLINKKLENSKLKEKLIFVNLLAHSSIMYRKNAAQKVGWYSNSLEYSQDYDLTLKLIKNDEIYLIRNILTYIIDRKKSMTNLKSLNSIVIKEKILILKKNMKFLLSKNDKAIIASIIDIYSIKLNIIEMKFFFFKNFVELIKIFFHNPLIIFRLNLIKSIEKKLNNKNK
jgi:glycosyltransferase involved in cell wall biosynthesis